MVRHDAIYMKIDNSKLILLDAVGRKDQTLKPLPTTRLLLRLREQYCHKTRDDDS